MNSMQLNLLSLSSDLTRVCQSIQRGSYDVSDRFSQESQGWIDKLQNENLKPYVARILFDLEKKWLGAENGLEKAEQCLMYSTLLQNYALKN